MNIHKIINLKLVKPKDRIHFKPFNDNNNVRCLNGSAHALSTTDINSVTCHLCLNSETNKTFWIEHELKHGNVNKN